MHKLIPYFPRLLRALVSSISASLDPRALGGDEEKGHRSQGEDAQGGVIKRAPALRDEEGEDNDRGWDYDEGIEGVERVGCVHAQFL